MVYWVIKWTKDGYTRVTFTIAGENTVLSYAITKEDLGYEVEIDICTEDQMRNIRDSVDI